MDAGDRSLFAVRSWADLSRWHRDYAADCDDGYLAEGVSDYVTATLAQDWRSVSRLRRQADRDPRFRDFVLRHIDATADLTNLETVLANATQRCPARSSRLCAAIAAAARHALQEGGSENAASLRR